MNGKDSVYIFHPFQIGDTGYIFTLGGSIPNSEIFAFLEPIKRMTTIIALISILIISLIIYIIVTNLIKKLGGEPDQVIEAMKNISEGDFTTKLHVKPNDSSSLVYSVQVMVSEMKLMLSQIIDNAELLRDTSTTLSSGANELSAGTVSQAERST